MVPKSFLARDAQVIDKSFQQRIKLMQVARRCMEYRKCRELQKSQDMSLELLNHSVNGIILPRNHDGFQFRADFGCYAIDLLPHVQLNVDKNTEQPKGIARGM